MIFIVTCTGPDMSILLMMKTIGGHPLSIEFTTPACDTKKTRVSINQESDITFG